MFVALWLTLLTEVEEDDDDAAEWNNGDGNDDDADDLTPSTMVVARPSIGWRYG